MDWGGTHGGVRLDREAGLGIGRVRAVVGGNFGFDFVDDGRHGMIVGVGGGGGVQDSDGWVDFGGGDAWIMEVYIGLSHDCAPSMGCRRSPYWRPMMS